MRVSVAVRFSRSGKERVWCRTISTDGRDGPAAAADLTRWFAAHVASKHASIHLRVIPQRLGGLQVGVAPVPGQSLTAFLEQTCYEDNGVFQLRAVFDTPSSENFVHVIVAFPGMMPAHKATASSMAASEAGSAAIAGEVEQSLATALVEQFECEATGTVSTLKSMIQARTSFPTKHMLLLLGNRRLHDTMPIAHVATDTVATPLQLHLAIGGAHVFLRRQGQGHREPTGPCRLSLSLPPCVQGSRTRQMQFDPAKQLSDLRWSVQAVSGLPPAALQFTLTAPATVARSLVGVDGSEVLHSLGFTDGCTLKVECDPTMEGLHGDTCDMPLDSPTSGSATTLYECAATKLGITDTSRLALFAGNTKVDCNADLAYAPLADGVVLSAYVTWSLQLSVSLLTQKGASPDGVSVSSSSSASPAHTTNSIMESTKLKFPESVSCLSSDTIAEVRERTISAAAATCTEIAVRLRGSKVFALDCSVWAACGAECNSLGSLSHLLGHFTPCPLGTRLSRLGLADTSGHLVFVPDPELLVEVEVYVSGESRTVRRLRVPGTTRLAELIGILEFNLREQPLTDCPVTEHGHCQWALPLSTTEGQKRRRSVSSIMGDARAAITAVGKRKSFGSTPPDDASEQRPHELSNSEFIADLHALHPMQPKELPAHCMCPISYDVMRDPVIIVGSGNTYDRKFIEQHLQRKHTDPLTNMELRRASDRRLVPNNALRSQIDEAERAQVDLRLAAYLGKRRRRSTGTITPGSPSSSYLGLGWLLGSSSGG